MLNGYYCYQAVRQSPLLKMCCRLICSSCKAHVGVTTATQTNWEKWDVPFST